MERIGEAIATARSEEIAHDTMRSMVRAAGDGRVCGGKPPWGYRSEKVIVGTDVRGNQRTHPRWIIDEQAQPGIERLFELLASDVGIHRIAALMNEESRPSSSGRKWTRTSVCDLARKVYVYEGTYVWGMGHTVEWGDETGRKNKSRVLKHPDTWVRCEEAHPNLISSEIAAAVRNGFALQMDSPAIYERRQPKQPVDGIHNSARNSRSLLSGLAICAGCGMWQRPCRLLPSSPAPGRLPVDCLSLRRIQRHCRRRPPVLPGTGRAVRTGRPRCCR